VTGPPARDGEHSDTEHTHYPASYSCLVTEIWTRALEQVYVQKQSKRNTGAESTHKVGL
jgi:hypothetical protein